MGSTHVKSNAEPLGDLGVATAVFTKPTSRPEKRAGGLWRLGHDFVTYPSKYPSEVLDSCFSATSRTGSTSRSRR